MVRKSTRAARRSSITCSTSAALLAKPDHEARFGEHRRIELFHPVEQLQRREIARARPHLGIKPRHGFEIVVVDIGPRRHDRLDRAVLAQEIGRQHLDRGGRRERCGWPRSCARNAPAPPSSRSSRSTEVTTMCASPSRATASPTRSGSCGSSWSGLPVATLQKVQARVHTRRGSSPWRGSASSIRRYWGRPLPRTRC